MVRKTAGDHGPVVSEQSDLQRMRNGQPEREGSEDPEMEMPGLQRDA